MSDRQIIPLNNGIAFHGLMFSRNRQTNEHRAICACGWQCTGPAAEVQARAATHDLDDPNESEAA